MQPLVHSFPGFAGDLFRRALFGLIALSLLQAQGPSWAWAKSAGGGESAEGQSIAVDTRGNVYVTGFFDSDSLTFGSTTLRNAGQRDIFVVKYDPNGQVLWAKSAGGNLQDKGLAIAVDARGNVYVTGTFASSTLTFGSMNLRNVGGDLLFRSDIFVVKYDPNGEVLWAKSAGGNRQEESLAIAVDARGNVYLTGTFGSHTLTFGSTTLRNTGFDDIFVVKYDPNGEVLWAKSAGGNFIDYGRAIAVDARENVYVTGSFESTTVTLGATILKNAGGADIFVVKYDPNGEVLWAKSIGGGKDERSYDIAVDARENVHITGYFKSSPLILGATTLRNAGFLDILVVKYDPNGQVLWAKSTGGNSGESGRGIAVDASGNVYVTGSSGSNSLTFGSTTLKNAGESNIFIVKYTPNGQILWAKGAGGSSRKGGKGITVDVSGNVYVTGGFEGDSLTLDAIELKSTGSYYMFVGKLKQ